MVMLVGLVSSAL